MTMPHRRLGALQVGAIGLGCMPMSWGYTAAAADPAEVRATLHRAVELGVTLFDTSDVYGPFTNEQLIGDYLVREGLRERVVIATKGGLLPINATTYGFDGSPTHMRRACDASLQRLGVDVIDLYQYHRVDPKVPLEDTWGALAELVAAGKVRYLGLSEPTIDQIDRAHAIHPVTSVQSELSIWTTDHIDNGVIAHCRAAGIGFLPFSPLGRGYLTGALDHAVIDDNDFRSANPRFTAEAMAANQGIVAGVARIAARHGVSPAQIALAWVLAQGEHIVPIPGTKRRAWLEDNVASVNVALTDVDLAEISALPRSVAPRY